MGTMSISIKLGGSISVEPRVFVPYGDHVYLNAETASVTVSFDEFSSPMGTMSISIRLAPPQFLSDLVFVPYGDHVYLNK